MLKKLSEAVDPTTMPGIDAFSIVTSGWYQPRYDAVLYISSSYLGSQYKIFRDGTAIRQCVAANAVYGYDADLDRVIFIDVGALPNYLHDPISTKHDPSRLASMTVDTVLAGTPFPFVWRGAYYTIAGAVVTKRALTTGTPITTYTLTGAQTWSGTIRMDICDDGTLVALAVDNGSYGVVRFFDLNTNENLYESVVPRSKFLFVDRVNRNVWSVRFADDILEVYSFDVQPDAFSPFTVGSNRSRYRQDAITATLVGAQGEPVPFYPVGWTLDPPTLGHLEHDYTVTDINGETENTYCGPQDPAAVGEDVTIQAWTGF